MSSTIEPFTSVRVRHIAHRIIGHVTPSNWCHHESNANVGTCDVCGRLVLRGMGRWWEREIPGVYEDLFARVYRVPLGEVPRGPAPDADSNRAS